MIDVLLARLLAPAPARAALAATVLRVGAGVIFIGFGQSKFAHHARETAAFRRYGLPDPSVFVYATGALEIACGILLVLGLATRLVAAIMAGNMVGAIATGGRVDGGFVNFGLAPLLLVVMLFLLWTGAGRWSLDEKLRRRLAPRQAVEESSRS